jgi:hypothetical protein
VLAYDLRNFGLSGAANGGISSSGIFEQRVILRTSIGFTPRAPQEWARNVRVPTFLYQVHDAGRLRRRARLP